VTVTVIPYAPGKVGRVTVIVQAPRWVFDTIGTFEDCLERFTSTAPGVIVEAWGYKHNDVILVRPDERQFVSFRLGGVTVDESWSAPAGDVDEDDDTTNPVFLPVSVWYPSGTFTAGRDIADLTVEVERLKARLVEAETDLAYALTLPNVDVEL
jgi:hypothetical protein